MYSISSCLQVQIPQELFFNKYITLCLAFINNAVSYQVELPIINCVIVIKIEFIFFIQCNKHPIYLLYKQIRRKLYLEILYTKISQSLSVWVTGISVHI